jgi:hypothetical protein
LEKYKLKNKQEKNMAIETTGSTVYGLIRGLSNHLAGSGGGFPELQFVNGNPNGVVTAVKESGLAVDVANGNYYMAEFTGGSTWYTIGSRT